MIARLFLILAVVAAHMVSEPCYAKASSKKTRGKIGKKIRRPIRKLQSVDGLNLAGKDSSRLTSGLGFRVIEGYTAISSLSRYSVRLGKSAYSVGIDAEFSLLSPGSLFLVLGGGWYEFRVSDDLGLSFITGAQCGVSSSTKLDKPHIGTTSLVFAEVALAKVLNQLASAELHFRPGWIGHYYSYAVLFTVSFRFPG